MSVEVEEQPLVVQPEDTSMESLKNPKRSYTRDFLLSLSELEVCKKLPKGFDESLLSEFDDASHGVQDRHRALGSSLQGFRKIDYGSSPPARGDWSNCSRGLNRWDSRSSLRSDTDSDSESGRRYGIQARRSWQNHEHDGLLGSGSFPRPAGYAAVPRLRPNENFCLNRSNEPYHPPRPYKAVPHSRRETNDSYNDETFGSADDTNEDRVEEEKKRRAEFELMRKEQQKALHEKQKSKLDKAEDPFSDIAGLLENPSDGKTSSELDKELKQASDDSSKVPASSQSPPFRPLVPPGFVSSVVDKNSTGKSLVHADPLEVGKIEVGDGLQDMKSRAQEEGSSDLNCQTSSPSAITAEKVLGLSSVLQGADQAKVSSLSDVSEVLENGEIMGLDFEVTGHRILGEPARSTSILDKLFGNPVTASSGSASNLVEDPDAKTDDIWSHNTLQSKFSHLFLEEDKKPVGNMSSGKPNNLLSLIVGGEKGGTGVTATGSIFNPETMSGHKTSNSASSTAEVSEEFFTSNVPEPKRAVLTCEDLEQSMLSEIGYSPSSKPPEEEHHVLDVKAGNPGTEVDNQASQHLLSLLQKGVESKSVMSISVAEQRSPDKPRSHEFGKMGVPDGNTNNANAEELNCSSKTLTLEALFGTAFMKELHSAQRNTVGSAKVDISDGAPFSSAMNENGNGIGSHESHNASIFTSNGGIAKDKIGDWFHDTGKEVEFSRQPAEFDSKFGSLDGGIGVTLPEEESLINLIDPINAENSILVPDSSSSNPDLLSSSSNTRANVIEKLAVLGGALKDERPMGGEQDPLVLHSLYNVPKPEFPYQNLHPQLSSPQLHAPQINHGRPLIRAIGSHPAHLDPHLNLMPPEALFHRDAPTHHQFPASIGHPSFPHPTAGVPGFDHPIPPILQQMHMAGSLPPPLMRGFPGTAPVLHHTRHNAAGYIEEHDPMQGLLFGQRQQNFGGPRMGLTGPELGVTNNPPEAFQRLLEMELRANSKQTNPFAAVGPSRAMHGPELDMGFRYR